MFDIMLDNQPVGFAQVEIEGCIYKISCFCNQLPKRSGRIIVTDGKKTINLGICVPERDRFVLTKRIPVRCLTQKDMQFSIASDNDNTVGIPVESGKAFPELDKLSNGKFYIKDGQVQILIDSASNLPDSDQIQGHPNKSELP